MWNALRWVLLIPLSIGSTAAFAQYTNVFIQAGAKVGRGIAVTRGLDCFAITAGHVVQEPFPISVVGQQRRRSAATVQWSNNQFDVAVLRLANGAELCGRDHYIAATDLAPRLKIGARALLGGRREDGSAEEIPVTLSAWGPDHITIGAGTTVLHEGLSGSVLYVAQEPAGILTSVSTGQNTGRVVRVDRIQALIGSFLPLQRPTDEEARYNQQLANDLLHKNLNFMESARFCNNLYTMARWLVEISQPLEYTKKERINADYHYRVPDIMIPGTDSVYVSYKSKGSEFRRIDTQVGWVAQTLDIEPLRRRADAALTKCVNDAGMAKNLRYREGPIRERSDRIDWTLAYTNGIGATTATIYVWLKLGLNIEVSVWSAFD